MRKLHGLALLTLCLMAWWAMPVSAQDGATIVIQDQTFAPTTLTIPAGAAVTWRNEGLIAQEVVAANGEWEAVALAPDASYTRFFSEPGVYPYYARGFGEADGTGLAGTILVEETAAGAAQDPPTPTPLPNFTPAVVVADQESDGRSVLIQEVIAAQPGFLLIHPTGADGLIDLVTTLGRASVQPGNSVALTVPLDPPMTGSATLYATLHEDMGSLGIYEFPGPDVPVQVLGAPLSEPFTLLVTPPPADLPTSGQPFQATWLIVVGGVLAACGLLLTRELARL